MRMRVDMGCGGSVKLGLGEGVGQAELGREKKESVREAQKVVDVLFFRTSGFLYGVRMEKRRVPWKVRRDGNASVAWSV